MILGGNTCSDGNCEKSVDGSLDFLSPELILSSTKQKVTSMHGYEAPEFQGLDNWINSNPIKSISDLKGQVVLIDFWTLGCINCINTHKETNKLYDEFKDEGFEIIGLHAPEFAYERRIENVEKAVIEFKMKFPIATDNDFMTWRAYNNKYWPAFYLIDKKGEVRYTHFGEGAYDEKRQAIIELLLEDTEAILQ